MLTTDATSLPRLMNCNGSSSMAVFRPAIEDANAIFKNEGIAAHYMAVMLNNALDYSTTSEGLIGSEAPNGVFMTEEMLDAVYEYLDYIGGRTPKGSYFSEMECETSHQNQQFYRVNGRADNVHHSVDNVLFIDDFKYGFKPVEPEMNWTLISHAIGYCVNRPNQPLPDEIVFSIIQPRIVHVDGIVRQWVIDQRKFLELWQNLINTLSNLSNELKTGEHCKRCPSLVYCSAATKAGYNAVEASDIVSHEEMTNKELSFTMDLLASSIKKLQYKLDALQELTLHKIKSGEIVENYQPEYSFGNKTWNGFVKPDLIKSLTGIDIQSGKMVTPNQAIKLGVPKEIVGMMTHKPNRGVKLKRVSTDDKAQKMFSNLKGEQNGD